MRRNRGRRVKTTGLQVLDCTGTKEAVDALGVPILRGEHQGRLASVVSGLLVCTHSKETIDALVVPDTRSTHQSRVAVLIYME